MSFGPDFAATVETELTLTYSADRQSVAAEDLWTDLADLFGTFRTDAISIEEIDTDHDAETTTFTVRGTYSYDGESLHALNNYLEDIWAPDGDGGDFEDSAFSSLTAADLSIQRSRFADGEIWATTAGQEEVVIEADGEEIKVPDEVDVIVDEEEVYDLPGDNSYAQAIHYQDMQGAAWYSNIVPHPGSADEHYDKVEDSESSAVRRAIRLAKKHDVPLLQPRHHISM